MIRIGKSLTILTPPNESLLPLLFSLVLWHAAGAVEPTPSGASLPPIDPADIVNSVTYDLGDRLMTVQEVTEAALPTPPPMRAPAPMPPPAPGQAQQGDRMESVAMGATIFTSKTGPARTLLSYHKSSGGVVEFWSSADWRLLANMGSFQGAGGRSWQFLLMAGVVAIEETEEPPAIPAFAGTQASFIVTQGDATPELLEPIQALHELYDRDHAGLLEGFNAREAARLQREAELKANPPVPQDILVRSRMLTPEEIEATKAP